MILKFLMIQNINIAVFPCNGDLIFNFADPLLKGREKFLAPADESNCHWSIHREERRSLFFISHCFHLIAAEKKHKADQHYQKSFSQNNSLPCKYTDACHTRPQQYWAFSGCFNCISHYISSSRFCQIAYGDLAQKRAVYLFAGFSQPWWYEKNDLMSIPAGAKNYWQN